MVIDTRLRVMHGVPRGKNHIDAQNACVLQRMQLACGMANRVSNLDKTVVCSIINVGQRIRVMVS
jgi:hypothetical protein